VPVYRGQIVLETPDAGWSETYFFNQPSISNAIANLQTICTAGMALRPPAVKVFGLRVNDTATPRLATMVAATTNEGTYNVTPLVADPALAFMQREVSTDLATRSRHYLRGIAADQLSTAQTDPAIWAPTPAFSASLTSWGNDVITNAVLGIKTAPHTYTTKPINNVTPYTTVVIRKAGRPFGLRRGRRLLV
jgi:hypothetical protein